MKHLPLIQSYSEVTLEMSLIFKALNSQYFPTIFEALEILSCFSSILFIPHSIFLINSNPYFPNFRFLLFSEDCPICIFLFFFLFSKLVAVTNFCWNSKIKEVECIRAWNKDLFFTQMAKHWLLWLISFLSIFYSLPLPLKHTHKQSFIERNLHVQFVFWFNAWILMHLYGLYTFPYVCISYMVSPRRWWLGRMQLCKSPWTKPVAVMLLINVMKTYNNKSY